MSNSLRDQLIKAGLATEKQLKQARQHDFHQHKKANQQKKQGGGNQVRNEAALAAAAAAAAKKERDRELNRKAHEEQEQRAREAQARDLVVKSEISRPPSDKDIAFHFTQDGKIKHVYVNPDIHKQLTAGKLAICRTRGRYRVVPTEIAEKVRPIAPYLVVFVASDQPEEDPAYAEHPIPDDLMW